MDGNRRWAMSQGLTAFFGHKNGWDAVKRVVDFCLEKKITHLSLYTFSIENLKRSADEQRYLFEVLAHEAAAEFEDFKQKNVRVSFIGDRALFPNSVKPICEKIERDTLACSALQLNFLFCYGGQQEIVDTAKRIAVKVACGDVQVLWTSASPAPDLIIRTGGDTRLSNFLLFQCAYSELYFIDCLWPDISVQHLEAAITYYDNCRKNFGN